MVENVGGVQLYNMGAWTAGVEMRKAFSYFVGGGGCDYECYNTLSE